MENVGGSSATNVILRSPVIMCLKLLQRGHFHSLPRCAQHAATAGILRQTGDSCCHEVESRSRLNLEDELICALLCIQHQVFIFSFIFQPLFLGEGCGPISHRARGVSQSTAISDISAGSAPSKVGDITPSGPWPTYSSFSRGCSQQDLPRLSWVIFDRWPNQRRWDLLIRRSGLAFKGLRISLLRTLSRSVTPWMPERGHCFQGCRVGDFWVK